MGFEGIDDFPMEWKDHEDIAMALYEAYGDDYSEGKIYRTRFTDFIEMILKLPNFVGKREDCNENHLEQIQAKWVYEWRDNQ